MSQNNREALVTYVTNAIGASSSEEQIKGNLRKTGWDEDQINFAFRQALVNNGVPSPDDSLQVTATIEDVKMELKAKKSSLVEVILNIASFALLGIIITAIGTLFYQVINKFFPDTVSNSNSYGEILSTSTLHYATAVLVVGYPIYYLVMYLWFRSFRRDESKKENDLSKFLTYVVLTITAVVMLGDLISTIYTFLQGDLSARFFLKALVTFTLAGLVFGFYYLERKKVQHKKNISRDLFRFFGLIVTGIVAVGIVMGFVAAGSPSLERSRGFDDKREQHLQSLNGCIQNYASKYQRLPGSITELKNSGVAQGCSSFADPVTMEEYEYRVVTPSKMTGNSREGVFELCATFELDYKESLNGRRYNDKTGWAEHEAGYSCGNGIVTFPAPNNN